MIKKQNKIYLAIGIVTIILLVGINYLTSRGDQEEDTIKIGAVYSLTGGLSFMGQPILEGTELAVGEINNKGGINGKKIELVVEDGLGSQSNSISAVNKLIFIDNVDFIFSDVTLTSMVISETVLENNKIMLYFGSINSDIAKKSDYIFKENINIEETCKAISQELKSRGITKVAFLRLKVDAYDPCVNSFKEDFLKEDGNKFLDESYILNTKDFNSHILKIKEGKYEAIFVLDHNIINPVESIGLLYKPKILVAGYGPTPIYQTESTRKVFSEIETIGFYPKFDTNSLNQEGINFINNYEKKFKKDPDYNSVFAYEGVYTLKEAIEKCGDYKDFDCISNEIKQTNKEGILGKVIFDDNGVVFRKASLVKFEEGEWIFLN